MAVTLVVEGNKEFIRRTKDIVDTVAALIILLHVFCSWCFQGGEERAARNKGRDVKYQLHTISPNFLVYILKENMEF